MMNQRKKFLYGGLALNLLFFLGVSWAIFKLSFVDRIEVLKSMVSELVKVEKNLIHQDRATWAAILQTHRQKLGDFTALTGGYNVVRVVRWNRLENEELYGIAHPEIPYLSDFINSGVPAEFYHRDPKDNVLYLSYFLTPTEFPQLIDYYIVTLRRDFPKALPTLGQPLQSFVTVLEYDKTKHHREVLFSGLERQQTDILRDHYFPPLKGSETYGADLVDLADGKYIYATLPLAEVDGVAQGVIFTFRPDSLVYFDTFAAAVLLIAILCLGLGFTLMSYIWSHEK